MLRDEIVKIWQQRWNASKNGRQTALYIKNVKVHQHSLDRYLLQFLTGHGRFPYYFHKFGLAADPNCTCGLLGDANHYIFHCPLTLRLRKKLRFDSNQPETLFHNKENFGITRDIVSWVCKTVPQI
ncbi:hypothetical protein AVEN_3987-1 [Araneus ventricosus]|uniref:Reverse transcriptase zinc-binding domain-containing protein n=1 Tax=Araneus ventricosus TaxID=182803 RepID=A0A4Y2VAZ0_ARAVE|nr:hypothetical protein AVEN_3987-1 [Araneus ventricosus]